MSTRHDPVREIARHLRARHELRSIAAATLATSPAGPVTVMTLAPSLLPRLLACRMAAVAWETQVHVPPHGSFGGLETRPRYVALDGTRDAALHRHGRLVSWLAAGAFPGRVQLEILAAMQPHLAEGAAAFRRGDAAAALAALNQAVALAGQLDATRAFLTMYAEIFLMRAAILEDLARDRGTAAYREFIAICAGVPERDVELLRAMAWAQEAVERLTPLPRGSGAAGVGRADRTGVIPMGAAPEEWMP